MIVELTNRQAHALSIITGDPRYVASVMCLTNVKFDIDEESLKIVKSKLNLLLTKLDDNITDV